MRSGDGYVINGSKQFISNARIGQTTLLFAMTDPAAGKKGMSCFIVANDTPGYQVARVEEKLGQKASDTCHLVFDDMRVPEDQRIGAEGRGLPDRAVHLGGGAHRHRGAERRHGPRGAGLMRSATRRSAAASARRSSTTRPSASAWWTPRPRLEGRPANWCCMPPG